MEEVLNKDSPQVKLRAFRAIDEPETCEYFVKGHEHVLKSIGVTKVTSSKNSWIENPAVFVLIVESLYGKKVYGGARIHVAGGSEPLPIEQATGSLDPKVFDLIFNYAQKGTGELCGLWNSREISGYGVGAIFLIRAAVAISQQIGITSLFALCAPYTINPVKSCGMELETSIGNKGTFYYPKLDLLATTMVLKDVISLVKADNDDRISIVKLRENLNAVRIEELRSRRIEIHYKIEIPNLANWSIDTFISNTSKG
ncbi:MAG: hypothetical protein EOP34_04200 [Rickettsiales bacterium]|nr:MAG: hypothetical protein EOP34_04200 [Rickettsiales bacterium]